jgi:hypothetical protein
MRKYLLPFVFALTAASASAQTATPGKSLQWDTLGVTGSVAATSGYNMYVDASASVALSGFTCLSAPVGATCTVPFPSMTPGAHVLTLTMVVAGAESPKSVPLNFTFILVVTPTGVRIATLIDLIDLEISRRSH